MVWMHDYADRLRIFFLAVILSTWLFVIDGLNYTFHFSTAAASNWALFLLIFSGYLFLISAIAGSVGIMLRKKPKLGAVLLIFACLVCGVMRLVAVLVGFDDFNESSAVNTTTAGTTDLAIFTLQCFLMFDAWYFYLNVGADKSRYANVDENTMLLQERGQQVAYDGREQKMEEEEEKIDHVLTADEINEVDCSLLGTFVLTKMNEQSLDRLWQHLDEDGSGEIEKDEVLNILQFTALLYVAFRYKNSGGKGQPAIDHKTIRKQLNPVNDWILGNKMVDRNVVTRDEFRTLFGTWLREYANIHGKNIKIKHLRR